MNWSSYDPRYYRPITRSNFRSLEPVKSPACPWKPSTPPFLLPLVIHEAAGIPPESRRSKSKSRSMLRLQREGKVEGVAGEVAFMFSLCLHGWR